MENHFLKEKSYSLQDIWATSKNTFEISNGNSGIIRSHLWHCIFHLELIFYCCPDNQAISTDSNLTRNTKGEQLIAYLRHS